MHSYIDIFNFTPQAQFKPLGSLSDQIAFFMEEQKAEEKLGSEKKEAFKEKILQCMAQYYKLVGVDESVETSHGAVAPRGILPRYTEALLNYFRNLQTQVPRNKEIAVLNHSGVTTIKIRYKYTDSVIKKLIKLGLKNPEILDEPLKLFLKGGALHDLIGIQFICSSPYEREWVARALYSFFEYEHRTDDHLLYGFYQVRRKSGYTGLHCDHTLFYPRFDTRFSEEPRSGKDFFSLYDPAMSEIEVLETFRCFFNVEIQLHTSFENLWAGMEHRNSYNIQAKGAGRSEKIAAQWSLLSDTMKNLESQFERLQVDTEQSRFDTGFRHGYTFVKSVLERLDAKAYERYLDYTKQSEELETLLKQHEISRSDYVATTQALAKELEEVAEVQEHPTLEILFLLQSAFVRYGLANHRDYFNSVDIYHFVATALKKYLAIYEKLKADETIYKSNLLTIITILRYQQLAQQYGLGLIHTGEGVMSDEERALVSYETNLMLFKDVLTQLNELTAEELHEIKADDAAFLKIIHRTDVLAREWELFENEDPIEHARIAKEVVNFRRRYISSDLVTHFQTLLAHNKIKNVGYVVKFYTTLVWHGLILPLDALQQIIRYSSYDKIKTSDLFFYELSAYKFLVVDGCESLEECHQRKETRKMSKIRRRHFEDFHRKNMIRQLFKIYKNEPRFTFLRAKFRFEQLTGSAFKMDHFSERF
jgi:ppGpp synthetase/RelA/SpoT-type nucleotidyltranferase